MGFDELERLLCKWYDAKPEDFRLPDATANQIENNILRSFYRRFGQLAERENPFKHPKSDNGPFSCQDTILPVNELKHEDGYTNFCVENQAVFVIAAAQSPTDENTYAKGDCIDQTKTVPMTDVGVPLIECLVTTVLRETIMSAGDRYRRFTSEKQKQAYDLATQGQHIQSRYIWDDLPLDFYLSDDIWYVRFSEMNFYAHKGLWKLPPSTWQEQKFEKGSGWSSGPANPTWKQKIEKIWTGWKNP